MKRPSARSAAPAASAPASTCAPAAARLNDWGELRRAWRQRQRELEAVRQDEQRAAAARLQGERERAWFRHAVGPVTPLRDPRRVQHPHNAPLPEPRSRMLDEASVLRESISDEFDVESLLETDADLAFRRPGIGPDVLKRLRRGHWSIQAQIDLHGLRRDEAREALGSFLRDAQRQGWRCVRVVHGKGLGSPGREPVLKAKVRSWLVQKAEVLAFVQARADEGGAGALVVLLDAGGPARA